MLALGLPAWASLPLQGAGDIAGGWIAISETTAVFTTACQGIAQERSCDGCTLRWKLFTEVVRASISSLLLSL